MSMDVTGRCLCGAVTFSAMAKSGEVNACHCGMCRRWAGGPLMVVDLDGAPRIAGEEDLTAYGSSEWGERVFCKVCGTSLFWRMRDGSHHVVSAHALDSTDGLRFTLQIFTEEKPTFYDFANQTEMMTGEEFVAAFSGKSDG